MATDIQEIPLSELTSAASNVRRRGRSQGIVELAAGMKAHGLSQIRTVHRFTKTKGTKKAHLFEVVAGGRRLDERDRITEGIVTGRPRPWPTAQ